MAQKTCNKDEFFGNIPVMNIGHASSDGLLVVRTMGAAVEPRADDNVNGRADGSVDDDIVSPGTKRKLRGKAGVDPVPVDNR